MQKWLPLFAIGALVGFALFTRTQLGEQSDGSFLVSTGQRIELMGNTTRLDGVRPKDMCLSPDRSHVALLGHSMLVVVDLGGSVSAKIGIAAAPLGIAWSPDGSKVYASLGNGKIGVFAWDGTLLSKVTEILAEGPGKKGNPGTAGLAVANNGTLYAALSIRNEVSAITPEGKIQSTWNVGACPYCLAISSDSHTLAVANRGGPIVGPSSEQGDPTTRTAFQGTGIPHAESAGTSVQIDPRTDSAMGGSVTLIDVDAPQGAVRMVNVGRQPSGMTFSNDGKTLFIADADEDAISTVDIAEAKERSRVSIAPKEDPAFGQIPTSVAISPDEKRIYVTLGGANSVAVLDNGPIAKVLGYFPTAWYPISVITTGDHVLVACAKGIGSRPSGKKTGFYVHDSVGAIQSFTTADIRDLRAMTRRVARNNGWTKTAGPRPNRAPVPIPERIGEPSVFTHVVYIIKENLAYDIAMGDDKDGNGDPSLCAFPENVTPNHHALARRFGLLDNFYISGTNSADGHQWVDSSVANDYTERNYGANERSYPYDGGDPLAFSPAGFLWSQAKAAHKTVRVFGEFVNKPSIVDTRTGKAPDWQRCWEDYKSGKGEVVIKAETSEAGLRESLDPTYIGFPLTVTDQWRADVFLSELRQWETSDGMPNLSILLLPNDHTGGTRPGWPTPRAEVADNDFALGRIVDGISHSKFWASTLIVVAEDDSQNGLDHVDGHRSICFCISPFSPSATNSNFYNHVSISATIGHVLGLPAMTRFDRTSKPMTGCFSDKPDFTPYNVLPNRVPIDELNPPAKSNRTAEARKLAESCANMDWSEPDIQDQRTLNRAIWLKEAPRSVGHSGFSTALPTALR
ncbi:MAG: bifunctional YncE family protein/alkaline phosphatase family protein [Fimbriimonas sp.]|nr:bifunctional YncE family protein/alkaline phosphatase family protein [Fimbriimonas sp.]